MFKDYFELGFDHILDLNAYDHILFIIALCAVYRIAQWRNILILVTAFTIGHCITLVLAGLDIISVPSKTVELLIPVTIFLTAIFNVSKMGAETKKIKFNYLLALFFGLIHGLGFSNYFKALLGKEESIVSILLPFNLGVEIGQLVIVLVTILIGFVLMEIVKIKQKSWSQFLSGAAAGISIILFLEVIKG